MPSVTRLGRVIDRYRGIYVRYLVGILAAEVHFQLLVVYSYRLVVSWHPFVIYLLVDSLGELVLRMFGEGLSSMCFMEA